MSYRRRSDNMLRWKARKRHKQGRGSRTPGKQKTGSPGCQASTLERYFARRSRSYKHPLYAEWCRRTLALNSRNKA